MPGQRDAIPRPFEPVGRLYLLIPGRRDATLRPFEPVGRLHFYLCPGAAEDAREELDSLYGAAAGLPGCLHACPPSSH